MPSIADVAVLGSGFAGSLCALLLSRSGFRCVLIDRASHPRFAIGESSTPVADLVLSDIARQYGLERIRPLARFGTWQATYPELGCGKKRGFSYFSHRPGKQFAPRPGHATELLVAASSDDEHSDTHWLRADVDAFFLGEAVDAGVSYFDRTEISALKRDAGWSIEGTREGAAVDVSARFVVDATGEGQVVPRALGIASDVHCLHSHSRAVFAHFQDVRPWHDMLRERGGDTADHPYHCDDAAVHQIVDGGWMWQLRFTNGVLSAGFAIDARRFPLDQSLSINDEWAALLDRCPTLRDQFAHARIVAPEGGLRRTQRMQRLAGEIAGGDWALLPHTAGFIDPLHSSGIAHSLCGVERLVRILRQHWRQPSLPAALHEYALTVRSELEFIDQLVAGCYATLDDFRSFTNYAMLYFAAATTYERRRQQADGHYEGAFLCADDGGLRRAVAEVFARVSARDLGPGFDSGDFENAVAQAIGPFNHAGLCDPALKNMYRYTALPRTATG